MEIRVTLKTQRGDFKLINRMRVLVSEFIKLLKQGNISMQAHEWALASNFLKSVLHTKGKCQRWQLFSFK